MKAIQGAIEGSVATSKKPEIFFIEHAGEKMRLVM
jgi:hypothetical protein